MVNLVKPGLTDGKPDVTLRAAMDAALSSDGAAEIGNVMAKAEGGTSSLLDIVRRMIPTNVIEACASGDLLAIIFFSILFAVAMAVMPGGPPGVVRDLFNQLADIMTLITTWIMKFTPIAVFCLMVPAIAEVGVGVLKSMVPYVLTVVTALVLHTVVVLPLVLKYLAKRSPMRHFKDMEDSLLMAFSTALRTAREILSLSTFIIVPRNFIENVTCGNMTGSNSCRISVQSSALCTGIRTSSSPRPTLTRSRTR
jgi:Na+/H+-dicarboxylate symporter